MPSHPILDQVLQLPPDERIRLIEDAWASLAASPESVPVPDWHRELLDDRLADASEVGRMRMRGTPHRGQARIFVSPTSAQTGTSTAMT